MSTGALWPTWASRPSRFVGPHFTTPGCRRRQGTRPRGYLGPHGRARAALLSRRTGHRWLYGRGARSYDEMTDLPAGLRSDLADRLALRLPCRGRQADLSDGTRKYLLRLAEGTTVETVGLPAGDRLTVCFSTQAGCSMGCSFCARGRGPHPRPWTGRDGRPGARRGRGLRVARDQRRGDGPRRAVRELRLHAGGRCVS